MARETQKTRMMMDTHTVRESDAKLSDLIKYSHIIDKIGFIHINYVQYHIN